MKTYLVAFLCFCCSVAFSQNWSVGLSFAPTNSNLKTTDFFRLRGSDYKPTLGFHALASITRKIGTHFALRAGIEYDHIASTYVRDFSNPSGMVVSNVTVTNHFDYLSLPIIVEARIGKDAKAIFLVGSGISAIVSSSYSFDNIFLAGFPDDVGLQPTPMNYFIIAGGGGFFPLSQRVGIEIIGKGNWGVKNISESKEETRTLAYFVSLGVQYQFVK